MVKEPANPTIEDNPDGNNYTGTVLRDKLIEYREQIISELKKIKRTETLVLNMEQTFDFPTAEEAKGTGQEQWVVKNFYHVPLAASTAMLTTLQSQIRSAESDLVDKLFTEVEGESLKFNRLRGATIPLSTAVTQGGDFEADVFMAAFDDANPPEVRLGKIGVKFDSLTMDLDGEYDVIPMEGVTGKLKIPAGGLGAQTRDGVIYFKPVGGELRKEPFYLDYLVLAPQLIVSPTKMNVFYKGLPNPVNISVPGFTSDKVFPRASAGRLSKGSKGYVMNIGSGSTVKISATVELPDGSKKQMPPIPFRVKRVPDPVPSFSQAKPTDNVISGLKVKNAKGLRADMGSDFEFDYTPIVTSFKVVTVVDGEIREAKCSGNKLSTAAKGILGNMRRGQKFSIEQIMVKMPEGNRKVSSISLRII
jgi:gliding motility-associated protein GldM